MWGAEACQAQPPKDTLSIEVDAAEVDSALGESRAQLRPPPLK